MRWRGGWGGVGGVTASQPAGRRVGKEVATSGSPCLRCGSCSARRCWQVIHVEPTPKALPCLPPYHPTRAAAAAPLAGVVHVRRET